MYIFKSGLTGCIAGLVFQKATIVDNKEPEKHKALLRFRSHQIADLVGIKFKKVKAYKGIWFDGESVKNSIDMQNAYSIKVTGKLLDRSISNLDPVERYIAPPDLHDIMLDQLKDRIKLVSLEEMRGIMHHSTDSKGEHVIKISTMSLFDNLALAELPSIPRTDQVQPIYVSKYKVPYECDVEQTLYYPHPDLLTYRATLQDGVLTIESMDKIEALEVFHVFDSFGISINSIAKDQLIIHNHMQTFGKLSPIDEQARRKAIYDLTQKYHVYSLGRVATWREKVLLDDCINDINVIRRLINSDHYDRRLHESNTD